VPGQKDDGQCDPRPDQIALEFESAAARQAHVENQAARRIRRLVRRNSSVEEKARESRPTELIRSLSAARMDGSSSMMKTTGCCSVMRISARLFSTSRNRTSRLYDSHRSTWESRLATRSSGTPPSAAPARSAKPLKSLANGGKTPRPSMWRMDFSRLQLCRDSDFSRAARRVHEPPSCAHALIHTVPNVSNQRCRQPVFVPLVTEKGDITLIFLHSVPDRPLSSRVIGLHAAHLAGLDGCGKLVMAGPLIERAGETDCPSNWHRRRSDGDRRGGSFSARGLSDLRARNLADVQQPNGYRPDVRSGLEK